MKGGRELFASGRGIWCIAVLLIATALVVIRRIGGAEWISLISSITFALLTARTADKVIDRRPAAQPSTPA